MTMRWATSRLQWPNLRRSYKTGGQFGPRGSAYMGNTLITKEHNLGLVGGKYQEATSFDA